jgi:membrane protease YdiL (CAAX protease family)
MDAGVSVSLMMIMAMYAQAIYVPHVHLRLLWIMLTGGLAYALWQQLEARLHWLLDPIERPPRRIGLSDGALAAMGFMLITGLLQMVLGMADLPAGLVDLLAYSAAGVLVALSTLWLLWRNGLKGIWRSTGLRPKEGWRAALASNLAWGVAGGVAAALFCLAYFAVLGHLALLPDAKAPPLSRALLLALTVLAAPLTEEFIFRGLLFAGLRASVPLLWAVPASAAIFALIHPTIAIVPVFVLGCVTALAYQRTGWLLAPMLAHGVYNAVVVLAQ